MKLDRAFSTMDCVFIKVVCIYLLFQGSPGPAGRDGAVGRPGQAVSIILIQIMYLPNLHFAISKGLKKPNTQPTIFNMILSITLFYLNFPPFGANYINK